MLMATIQERAWWPKLVAQPDFWKENQQKSQLIQKWRLITYLGNSKWENTFSNIAYFILFQNTAFVFSFIYVTESQ